MFTTTRIGLVAAVCVCLPLAGSQALAQFGQSDSGVRNRGFAIQGQAWQGSDWLSDNAYGSTEWQLGVTTQNTKVGVLVNSVAPGSAAARAGIMQGDLIINVDGFQVGMAAGRLYDLAEEINRRADNSGVVSLTLQDHRSLQLDQIRIQLDSSSQSLKGNIVYRGRAAIPLDAVVRVQIENVSRPYVQVRHGTTVFRPTGGATMPFEIAYDPDYIYPQDTYQVRAIVTSQRQTILESVQPQRVLTNGQPSSVQLQLVDVSSNRPGSGLAGTTRPDVISAGYPNYNQVDREIQRLYRRYLGREPSSLELAVFRNTPGILDRIDELPLELMAGQEYYDATGNNNRVWLQAVFQEIVGQVPNSQELVAWTRRYEQLRGSRTELLRQLMSQAR
ncbi:MAG: YbaY family lipoprotein [Pirellulaceae bacterium]